MGKKNNSYTASYKLNYQLSIEYLLCSHWL